MADYIGRELGLPSLQINPGSWGKLFREEQVVTALTLALPLALTLALHPRLNPSPFTLALASPLALTS